MSSNSNIREILASCRPQSGGNPPLALRQAREPSETLSWRTFTRDNFEEALAEWRMLERRLGTAPVACSAVWTDCWLRAYGDIMPCEILLAESGRQPRGVCLLTRGVQQKLGPLPLCTLHLGTAGEPQPGSVCVEYNSVLAEPASRTAFLDGVMQAVHQDRRWEQFRLDGLSQDELQDWLPHLPGAKVRFRDSRYFDLDQSRRADQELLATLGRSTRSNIRRKLKQYGELDCEWATDVDTASDIFEELVVLHQARWQADGQPGAFANTRFLRFQRSLCVQLFLDQKAALFRVRHRGEAVGCLMLLVDGARLLDYLSGFASFEVKPSPGLISHYLCMESALQRGFAAYDFLVGDKQHKANLSNAVNQLCWLTWSRRSWKFAAAEWWRKRRANRRKDSPPSE